MATIVFKADEIHYEENYLYLFIETYNPARTNKERVGGWVFETEDFLIEQISALCERYHMKQFEREAYCIFEHMRETVKENSIRVPKKIWESKFQDQQDGLDAWVESASFERMLKPEDVEYIKLKHKKRPGLIKYEGVLLEFILEAIAEKLERDKDKLNEVRHPVMLHNYHFKARFAPKKTKDDEKRYAFYITWFFRDQLDKKRLDSEQVNKERIDEFGAELMKLAGFVFACDEKDFVSTLEERKKNFRTWKKEHKKYLDEYGLMP